MLKNSFIARLLLVSFVAVAVVSCGGGGGGGSSSGDSDPNTSGVTGRAIKGAISGGTVICYNEDGNNLEQTTTDSDGNYVLKADCPATGMLVVRGGTDKSTGEQVEELIASGDSQYITPVTTMEYIIKENFIRLADTDSNKLIQDAKVNDPTDNTSTESKKLLKMAVALHSMTKNLQQQSEEELSYKEAMRLILEQMSTKPIKNLADDNKKTEANELVKKVFDDLEKGGKIKIPKKNREKVKKIIDTDSIDLQREDAVENGLKDFVPTEFLEPLPPRYVRVSKEDFDEANGKYRLKFDYRISSSNSRNLKYECKIFARAASEAFTYRKEWNVGKDVDKSVCDVGKEFSIDKKYHGNFLVIRYHIESTTDQTKGYSAPHRIGSMADLGKNDTLEFDSTVYLPIKDSYEKRSIASNTAPFDTGLSGAEKDLETGSNRMGYLPVGFYYKPTQVPTSRFKFMTFGVKLQIGNKDFVMMANNLYVKENSLNSASAVNPYLHNVGNNSNSLLRFPSVYRHNVNTTYIRDLLSDLIPNSKRVEYHTKTGFLRFKKPTESGDVLKINNQGELGSGDNLIGVSLADLCNRPISPSKMASGEFNGTLCDYIRSTINVEQATSVTVTPFIRSTRRFSSNKNLFKTDQSKIAINGVADYTTFPSITIKGKPVSKKRLIVGQAGLKGIDSDGDGISDYDEMVLGRDPFSASDINNDKDGDGLSDKDELDLGLNPHSDKDKFEFVVSKNKIRIAESSVVKPFEAIITGSNSISKFINVTFAGKAENVITLDVNTGSDVRVLGKKTINVTPKTKFGAIDSPRIVITAKISKGLVVKTLGSKEIIIVVDGKNTLQPKSVSLSYKTSASGGSAIGALSKSNFLPGTEITASVEKRAGLTSVAVPQYRWKNSSDSLNWSDISDATSSKYIIQESDIGKFISVSVVYVEVGKPINWLLKLSKIAKNSSGMIKVYPIKPTRVPTLVSDETISDKFYISSVITMNVATKSGHNILYKWKSRTTSVAPNNVWRELSGDKSMYTIPKGTKIGTQYQGCYAYTKNGVTSAYVCSITNTIVESTPRISSIEFKNGNSFGSVRVHSYIIKTDGKTMSYYRNGGGSVDSELYILVTLPAVVSDQISSANANVVISDGTRDITVPAFKGATGDNVFDTRGKAVALFKLSDISVLKSAKTYTIKSIAIPGYPYDLPKSSPSLAVEFSGWSSGENIGSNLASNTAPYRRLVGDTLQVEPITLNRVGLNKLYKWQTKSADSDGDCSIAVKADNNWSDITSATSKTYQVQSADAGKCVRATVALQINATPAKPIYKAKNIESAAVAIAPASPTAPPTLVSDASNNNKFYRLSIITMATTTKSGYTVVYKWQDNTSGKFSDITTANAKGNTYQVPHNFKYGDQILGCYAYKKISTNIPSAYKCSDAKTVEEKTANKQDSNKIGNWHSKKEIIMQFNRPNNKLYVAVESSAIPQVAKTAVPRLEISAKVGSSWNNSLNFGKDSSSRCNLVGKFSLPSGYECFGNKTSRAHFKVGGQIKVRWAEYVTGKQVSKLTNYSDALDIDDLVLRLATPPSVSINGTEKVGEVLIATTTGVPLNAKVKYQWQRSSAIVNPSWDDIGTTSRYTLETADGNKYIRVRVMFEKLGYDASAWKDSKPTGQIARKSAVKLNAPTTVAIIGTEKVFSTLSATHTAKPDGATVKYEWQWAATKVNPHWNNIDGQVNSTYTLEPIYNNKYIRVRVRFEKASVDFAPSDWTESPPSKQISLVEIAKPNSVSITGNPKSLATLTATHKTSTTGVTAIYYWQSMGSSTGAVWTDIVAGTANTYTLKDIDVGKFIRVKVKYQKTNYADSDLTESNTLGPIAFATPNGVSISRKISVLTATTTNRPTVKTKVVYDWYRSPVNTNPESRWTKIASGTINSYSLKEADKNKYIYVRVRYQTDTDAHQSDWSNPLAFGPIKLTKLATPGGIIISGSGEVFSTLTVTIPNKPKGVTVEYNWQSALTTTATATWQTIANGASYTLKLADRDKYIRVRVRYKQTDYANSDWAEKIVTRKISLAKVESPRVLSVYGDTKVLSTLTATISNKPANVTVVYNWQRASKTTAGATWTDISSSSSYTLQLADKDNYIRVRVRYERTNYDPSDWAERIVNRKISLAKVESPTGIIISGTGAVSSALTAIIPNKPANTTVVYNWQRASMTTAGATWTSIASGSTYTLKSDDGNKYIRVQVRYERTNYAPSDWVNSNVKGKILQAKLDTPTGIIISGARAVFSALTATIPNKLANTTVVYNWQRASTTTAGATWTNIASGSTYTLKLIDKYIRVQVRYERTNHAPSDWLNSNVTKIYLYATTKPNGVSIIGSAVASSTYTIKITNQPPQVTAVYEWQRFVYQKPTNRFVWVTVNDATSSTYRVTRADKGYKMRARVKYQRVGYADSDWVASKSKVLLSKDPQNKPTDEPTVDADEVFYEKDITITNLQPLQEYRIVDIGVSAAPRHISFDAVMGVISASSPGLAILQTRMRETQYNYASPWTDGIFVKFFSRSYITGNPWVGSDLSNTKTVYQWTEEAIVQIGVKYPRNNGQIEYVGSTTGEDLEYRLVGLDGTTPAPVGFVLEKKTSTTYAIHANGPGSVKVQYRKAKTATKAASAWSTGTVVEFRDDSNTHHTISGNPFIGSSFDLPRSPVSYMYFPTMNHVLRNASDKMHYFDEDLEYRLINADRTLPVTRYIIRTTELSVGSGIPMPYHLYIEPKVMSDGRGSVIIQYRKPSTSTKIASAWSTGTVLTFLDQAKDSYDKIKQPRPTAETALRNPLVAPSPFARPKTFYQLNEQAIVQIGRSDAGFYVTKKVIPYGYNNYRIKGITGNLEYRLVDLYGNKRNMDFQDKDTHVNGKFIKEHKIFKIRATKPGTVIVQYRKAKTDTKPASAWSTGTYIKFATDKSTYYKTREKTEGKIPYYIAPHSSGNLSTYRVVMMDGKEVGKHSGTPYAWIESVDYSTVVVKAFKAGSYKIQSMETNGNWKDIGNVTFYDDSTPKPGTRDHNIRLDKMFLSYKLLNLATDVERKKYLKQQRAIKLRIKEIVLILNSDITMDIFLTEMYEVEKSKLEAKEEAKNMDYKSWDAYTKGILKSFVPGIDNYKFEAKAD